MKNMFFSKAGLIISILVEFVQLRLPPPQITEVRIHNATPSSKVRRSRIWLPEMNAGIAYASPKLLPARMKNGVPVEEWIPRPHLGRLLMACSLKSLSDCVV